MSDKPVIFICDDCGSTDVSAEHVTGYWNVNTQEWDYEHGDSMYCMACGDNGCVSDVEYIPERFTRYSHRYEIGDTVKFEPDMRPYDIYTATNTYQKTGSMCLR